MLYEVNSSLVDFQGTFLMAPTSASQSGCIAGGRNWQLRPIPYSNAMLSNFHFRFQSSAATDFDTVTTRCLRPGLSGATSGVAGCIESPLYCAEFSFTALGGVSVLDG